ncbi:NAD-dependent protein deacetylase [Luminiphilus sp.]|jgi:NAD-dependent SIR2 family protein deacetylase|nr:NAD-dependent protein deacetylase [Luminiphilus sp.]MDB2316197.1 NAD-dependent protein deacetylase [Luminiphilus sp.]MDB2378720.1 NAD-dependent protein deacetylase [Luminiphilus sp.]MDB2380246.1 NAD-dependent protein deacetylase [Luminiphilus sp.]MDB2512831.1 NAD-dependent protein deacetylase [Luminiphilus sp.]
MSETVESLSTWLRRIERWTVLTGAGISADSGIPTYRDQHGKWLRVDPIQHKEFIESDQKRKRYWARSMVGWPGVEKALPNVHHTALATLERIGKISTLITQNVDRLHQKAGSQRVIDLHGRLDRVVCLSCGQHEARAALQARLLATNPFVVNYSQIARPDGDADVPDHFVAQTQEPVCTSCGGVLMPDVVFFGGTVPKPRVDACVNALNNSTGLLVVGSSLQVYSGFRFCRMAEKLRMPIIIVNEGDTRADDIATLKVSDAGLSRLVSAVDQITPNQERKSA